MSEPSPFMQAFRGSLRSALRWEDLDALFDAVRRGSERGWYVYALGEPPPAQPATPAQLRQFLQEIDLLLRREHEEDYCGIVYADDHEEPNLIKIYDPNNLGVVCGFSSHPPLPGWVLSTLPPVDVPAAMAPPANRRRWWQRLFAG